MSTEVFQCALLELAACDSVQTLLEQAVEILERRLGGARVRIELWDGDERFSHGVVDAAATRRCWIGTRYTLGEIHAEGVDDNASVELLALQLAPLAELLIERDASQRRTIREDVDRLYERRIREALIRSDWNASEVARALLVSRNRIAHVARRHKTPGRSAPR